MKLAARIFSTATISLLILGCGRPAKSTQARSSAPAPTTAAVETADASPAEIAEAAPAEITEAAPTHARFGPFAIHTVKLQFTFGHVLTEEEVFALTADLVAKNNVLVPPTEDDTSKPIRLEDLTAATEGGVVALSADGVRAFSKAISDAHINLGLIGVWVAPDTASLADGELLMEIVLGKVGRVEVLTTDPSGVKSTDPDEYQWVLDDSPIQPGDFLYRDKLDTYVQALRRTIGLNVEVALSAMPGGEVVLVSYQIEPK